MKTTRLSHTTVSRTTHRCVARALASGQTDGYQDGYFTTRQEISVRLISLRAMPPNMLLWVSRPR